MKAPGRLRQLASPPPLPPGPLPQLPPLLLLLPLSLLSLFLPLQPVPLQLLHPRPPHLYRCLQ